MTSGIKFTSIIYLKNISINDIYVIDEYIKDIETHINKIKKQLYMYVNKNPHNIITGDNEYLPIKWVHDQIEELIDELHTKAIELYNLNLYKEFLTQSENGYDENIREEYKEIRIKPSFRVWFKFIWNSWFRRSKVSA